ncbi:DMT family transporter [Oceaniovalibus sp. ACAM 378]|uniref:DMT family transporter n=1 Tax=Oceaniovalibus sp. ACAM 378 TaxID=2599923 RepID=UPI002105F5B9|nr:DMT family transporter [Oceaniovalibus sp. ACAM 378]
MNTNAPLRAILLMTLGMAGFAASDTFVKLSTGLVPAGQIVAIMGTGGALIFGVLARLRGVRLFSRDILHPAILLRTVAEATGTLGFVLALQMTTLSVASAVIQANPLVVTLGAAVLLREPVGWRRWAAIMVGFVGVMVMLKPDSSGVNSGALMALVSVVGLSTRDLATRSVPARVPTVALAAYGFAILVPAGIVVMAIGDGPRAIDGQSLLLLLGMIVFGSAAYMAMTASIRLGDLSAVAPFRYTRLIFAFTLGAVVFGERQSMSTLIGAAVVAAAGLYTLWRETRVRRYPA